MSDHILINAQMDQISNNLKPFSVNMHKSTRKWIHVEDTNEKLYGKKKK